MILIYVLLRDEIFSQQFCQLQILPRTLESFYFVVILVIEMQLRCWTTDSAVCDFDTYYFELTLSLFLTTQITTQCGCKFNFKTWLLEADC